MHLDQLVAIAELCSHLFADDPLGPSTPTLSFVVAVPDASGSTDDAFGIEWFGPVDYDELLHDVVPTPGTVALVLHASGWAAPAPDGFDLSTAPTWTDEWRPSQSPARRRVRITTALGAGLECVTVLRDDLDPDPIVLTGGAQGRVPTALECCWLRGLFDAA